MSAFTEFENGLKSTEEKRIENYELLSRITSTQDKQMAEIDQRLRTVMSEVDRTLLKIRGGNSVLETSEQHASQIEARVTRLMKDFQEQVEEMVQVLNVSRLRNELEDSIEHKLSVLKEQVQRNSEL